MQRYLNILAAFLTSSFGFGQDLIYEVSGSQQFPVKQQTLHHAKTLSDIIPHYPVSWISNYTGSEITVRQKGTSKQAVSRNDTLSIEQKQLLKESGPSAEVTIHVLYDHQVFVTHVTEHNAITLKMTVVPEIQAEYKTGYNQLISYLKDHSSASLASLKEFRQVIVQFTVNETGSISDVELKQSSENAAADRLLLGLIRNMPAWKPAENPKGKTVKQIFEFSAGKREGC